MLYAVAAASAVKVFRLKFFVLTRTAQLELNSTKQYQIEKTAASGYQMKLIQSSDRILSLESELETRTINIAEVSTIMFVFRKYVSCIEDLSRVLVSSYFLVCMLKYLSKV